MKMILLVTAIVVTTPAMADTSIGIGCYQPAVAVAGYDKVEAVRVGRMATQSGQPFAGRTLVVEQICGQNTFLPRFIDLKKKNG